MYYCNPFLEASNIKIGDEITVYTKFANFQTGTLLDILENEIILSSFINGYIVETHIPVAHIDYFSKIKTNKNE